MTATTLSGVLLSGVAGSRPAANAVAAGTLYAATDTHLITQSDGVSTWSTWIDAAGSGLTNPMTTKGDIIQADTGGAAVRLAAGTSGYVLTAGGAGSFSAWAAPAAGSLTNTQVFLGADVNMPTANVFYDGPTYTPASGTWLLIASAIIIEGSGSGQRNTAKLWDGTTSYAATQHTSAGGERAFVTVQAIVTGTGSAVFKMSVAGNGGTQTMAKTPDTNNTGLTGLGTYLIAIKIG